MNKGLIDFRSILKLTFNCPEFLRDKQVNSEYLLREGLNKNINIIGGIFHQNY